MHYLDDFDPTSPRVDLAQDRLHQMALDAQARDHAIRDMKAAGLHVNREELIASSF
jgi:hypothetical protein